MSSPPNSGRGIVAAIEEIDRASDEVHLRAGVDRARQAVAGELTARTPTLTLAAAWSEVMRHAIAAAAGLVTRCPEFSGWGTGTGEASTGWTWFVSGSVARGEAIPGSDFETLIVLDDAVDDAGKAAVMALAAEVHAILERCGLRADANGVLASRGRFCRRRASWAEGTERWCARPAEDRGVVMTGLLSDATGVWGRSMGAGDELRSQAVDAARRHPASRRAMLQDATSVRATIPSRLRVFATHDDSVDLKVAAVDPLVKIARWAGLSAGSNAVSTLERLHDAAAAKVLEADDASMLGDCYLSLSRIRWRVRAAAWVNGGRVTERVSLAELPPLERAALRTVARELAGLRLKLDFLASTSSFS